MQDSRVGSLVLGAVARRGRAARYEAQAAMAQKPPGAIANTTQSAMTPTRFQLISVEIDCNKHSTVTAHAFSAENWRSPARCAEGP